MVLGISCLPRYHYKPSLAAIAKLHFAQPTGGNGQEKGIMLDAKITNY